jgi:hypothetical protein
MPVSLAESSMIFAALTARTPHLAYFDAVGGANRRFLRSDTAAKGIARLRRRLDFAGHSLRQPKPTMTGHIEPVSVKLD